jgi:dihydroorotate dehydrogenase
MGLYQGLLRPLLFNVDPEKAHHLAIGMIARGLFKARPFQNELLEQTLLGKRFPNPLGLAAGFDKDAVALRQWPDLGFGHVEVGTVTRHPQPGNEKPRLFRLPSDQALINRMGFNNAGAEAMAWRLKGDPCRVPVGVNLGKSKITPLEEAPEDYRSSFKLLHQHGDYFVVNVSSPNTPGLRELQEKEKLREIIAALQEVDAEVPLFVKISPDLELSALDDVVEVAVERRLAGLIATNTTLHRDNLTTTISEEGGLSGRPLRERANDALRHLYRSCPKEMILIGVGGIGNGRDLFEKISLGAHLCQVYTGWIYGGLQMIPDSLEELAALMRERGLGSLSELRGSAA